jgi:hypothetical protein
VFIVFFRHYACCNGDTWASELGVLSKATPRLITTLRPVPTGTNGGITVLGCAASTLGGFVIGLAFALADLAIWFLFSETGATSPEVIPAILLGTLSGIAGSLVREEEEENESQRGRRKRGRRGCHFGMRGVHTYENRIRHQREQGRTSAGRVLATKFCEQCFKNSFTYSIRKGGKGEMSTFSIFPNKQRGRGRGERGITSVALILSGISN